MFWLRNKIFFFGGGGGGGKHSKACHLYTGNPNSASYRQHARTQKKIENRPHISYYSRDYNEQPTSDLVSIRTKPFIYW